MSCIYAVQCMKPSSASRVSHNIKVRQLHDVLAESGTTERPSLNDEIEKTLAHNTIATMSSRGGQKRGKNPSYRTILNIIFVLFCVVFYSWLFFICSCGRPKMWVALPVLDLSPVSISNRRTLFGIHQNYSSEISGISSDRKMSRVCGVWHFVVDVDRKIFLYKSIIC